MALPLTFELRLEERGADRVFVSVLLGPDGGAPTAVDGVALQLHASDGTALGHRMLLPIAGAVTYPMLSTIELRTQDGSDIALGCRVHGTVWAGCEQLEAMLPTDPYTELEVHARGRLLVPYSPDEDRLLEPLLPEERVRIAADFPWVNEPRVPPQPVPELEVVDHDAPQTEEQEFHKMCGDLGLDDQAADFLKELMSEEV